MVSIAEFKASLNYLYDFSERLTRFKEDDGKILEAIIKMDKNEIFRLQNLYKGREKVREMRYYIVNKIYQDVHITIEDIEKEKEEINIKHTTNVFQAWSNFSILFELFYKKFKETVKNHLKTIHLFFREHLDENFNPNKTFNGFDWNNNFGTTNCWIALFPEDLKDHKDCVHLFFEIDYAKEGKIEYGLYYGRNLSKEEKKETEFFYDISKLEIQKIVEYFKSLIPKYNSINQALKETKTEKTEEELEKITKTIDFSKLSEKFNEIPLYFENREDIKNQIIACLESNKNIIFFGPPGTGKTKLAEEI